MDKIGTSHIASVDMLICVVTLGLIVYLKRVPRDSIWSRALEFLCLCSVFAIIALLILAHNLGRNAVFELAAIAFLLCKSIWDWNDAKTTTDFSNVESTNVGSHLGSGTNPD